MEGLLAILGKVGFDWQVALANFVNFLIIFFVLKKFAFGPIGKVIEERRNKIEKGLTDAKEAELALNTANVKKKEIIRNAREEAKNIIVSSQEEKKSIIKDAKVEAITEKEKIVAQAKIEAEKERKNAEDLFNKEASVILISSMKKTLEGYVNAGKGEEIIKAMIKK